MTSLGRKWVARHLVAVAVVLLTSCLLVSAGLVVKNHLAFRLHDETFAKDAKEGWSKPGPPPAGFEVVNYPYFLEAGHHRLRFSTNRQRIRLEVYALDCVQEIYVDGRRVYKRQEKCRNSRFITRKNNLRAEPVVLDVTVDGPGEHVLGVVNYNVRGRDVSYARDLRMVFVEHHGRAAFERVVAFFSGLVLLMLAYARLRGRKLGVVVRRWLAWRRRYAFVLLAFGVVMIVRASVSSVHLTGDVHHATLLYVENIFHKTDLHFATLDPQYTAAKYWGKSYMHKPAGLYYQYIPARWLLGYTHFYRVYASRLPGLLGDLLISLTLWRVVFRSRRRKREADVAVALYLLSPVVFFVNGYVGRVDALPVALLFMAVANERRWRYALYLGASVGTKQLAVLAGPFLALRPKLFTKTMVAALVTIAMIAPFVLDNHELWLERMTKPQLDKPMSGLTWMANLKVWGYLDKELPNEITLRFIMSLPVLALLTDRKTPSYRTMAFLYVGFMLFARNVAEHYLLWSAPFLIVVFVVHRHTLAACTYFIIQVAGLLHNDRIKLITGDPAKEFSLLLGLIMATYFFTEALHVLSPRDLLARLMEPFAWLKRRRAPQKPPPEDVPPSAPGAPDGSERDGEASAVGN